jgi:hypothetical protein
MFQLAVIYAYAKRHGKSPALPARFISDPMASVLQFPNVAAQFIPVHDLSGFAHYEEPSFAYAPIPPIQGSVDLNGYFQSERHFEYAASDIRRMFTPDSTLLDAINGRLGGRPGLVSVHVRRGDYVDHFMHYVCTEGYYREAIRRLNGPGTTFVFFSDDLAWCRTAFADIRNAEFYQGDSDVEDLLAMSRCQHNIISNSTFSWWASWLNTTVGKIVLSPNRWFTDQFEEDFESIYREDMTRL